MATRFERRERKLSSISLAAVVAVALTVQTIEDQNHEPTQELALSHLHVLHNQSSAIGHIAMFNTVPQSIDDKTAVHLQPHNNSPTHLTPAQIAYKEVTPTEFKEWSKVNVCEEGGNWHVAGPEYSGGLGISNENWTHFKSKGFPTTATTATPYEQIIVARRIQKDPPDQNGCDGSW